MSSTRTAAACITAGLALIVAASARAGGLEVPDNGSVALGRGGAFAARASDPTALMHDTAGIVGLEGVQVVVSSNFGSFANCFQRAGTYPSNDSVNVDNTGTVFENSHYGDGGVAYPRVCRESTISVAPQILATWRPRRDFAIGLGVYGPFSSASNQVFPDRVMTSAGLAPSPVRHMIFDKNLLLFYPTLAAAFAPVPWLRIGGAIQPSWAHFQLSTMVNTSRSAPQGPADDIRIDLDAQGFFAAGNVALQLLPSPWLSIGAQVHINGNLDLAGHANATASYYAALPADQVHSVFTITRMHVALPWNLRAGARFVVPRTGRPRQVGSPDSDRYDPMRDDVMDLEADFYFEPTSVMSLTTIEATGSIGVRGTLVPAPAMQTTRSDQRDVYGVRVGGDVNLVPGILAVRAGVAYETGSQSTQWAALHVPSFDTLSIHVGASVRYRWIMLSAAYAHYFMADFNAVDGQRPISGAGGPTTMAACQHSAGLDACTINRGVYTGSLDVFNVGLSAHF